MTLENLLAGVECVSVAGEPTLEICGVTNDSRRVEPGWCFIAVRGYETDGHRFIPAALARGAALIVAEEPVEGAASAVVKDSRRAEALIAANFYGRPAEKLRMVGITGTNGKTTTTNLIRSILLKATGRPIGLIGTNRNIVGDAEEEAQRTTPDSIELQALLARMVAAGAAYCVMEVSSHALYLDRTAGVRFAAGAFTNLTEDHLDFHKTMEAYAAAKSILFTQCDTAVVNLDDPWADTMLDAARCPALTFSAQGKAASLAAREIVLRADGVAFDLVHEGAAHRVTLGIPGLFSVYNALCALGVTTALGVPLPEAIAALGETGGVKGRAEVVPTGREFTVLIDYAHSPDAMENILNTVRGFARG
ncbi:MAG: UDP-N-acetylmuramoyl-L-alanyl-D-glutamate--2,6-diaminopimelate ligase, partial [bacterium]